MRDSSHEVDILMITYNRPVYTRLALKRLLDTCDESMRVWLWHNGSHEETLAVVSELAKHPAVHKFHHSVDNRRLREPTNWLYRESRGGYVSKVDDDCLVPDGWARTLRAAHQANERLGVIACWHFHPMDSDASLAAKKVRSLGGGHQVLENCWVGGSAYLMKRQCVAQAAPIGERETFANLCFRLARQGRVNGWYYPFLYQEHMDDPRSPHTLLKSDADLLNYMPLSAQTFGASTLAEWEAQLRRSAKTVLEAPADPRMYSPWRLFLRRKVYGRFARFAGLPVPRW